MLDTTGNTLADDLRLQTTNSANQIVERTKIVHWPFFPRILTSSGANLKKNVQLSEIIIKLC